MHVQFALQNDKDSFSYSATEMLLHRMGHSCVGKKPGHKIHKTAIQKKSQSNELKIALLSDIIEKKKKKLPYNQ